MWKEWWEIQARKGNRIANRHTAYVSRVIGGGEASVGESESVCSRPLNASIPSINMMRMHHRIIRSRKAAGG